jgi:ABC-type antimicrobial peptide transport system permease subunit
VFGLMGVLALAVAAMGLYSVMSYLVAQRTHEMGVRIALGAGDRDILALILRSSLGMAAFGVVFGLGLALASGRFVAPLLFETSPRDPGVFGGVALAMLAVALLASLVPALRARRVNPMEALRAE